MLNWWIAAIVGLSGATDRPEILAWDPKPGWDYQPPPASRSVRGTQCRRGETVVYACDFGRKRVSICQQGRTMIYRYGPPGAPEIELGRDAPPTSIVLGNQEASEVRLRFANGEYSYFVYVRYANIDMGRSPEGRSTGILVWRGDEPVMERRCPQSGPLQSSSLTNTPPTVEPNTDARFDAW